MVKTSNENIQAADSEVVIHSRLAAHSAVVEEINKSGFFIYPQLVSNASIEQLLANLALFQESEHAVKHGGNTYALRNIFATVAEAYEIGMNNELLQLIELVLGQSARPVRAILFDKTDKVNWNLVWHQDLTIAVKEKREVEGFGPWTLKANVPHVQPPLSILENMLAARIHLDDCGIENGALKVLPGTHAIGRLSPAQIQELRKTKTAAICTALKGDVLFMRPLLLHSSQKAVNPSHRRVLHIEYAGMDLPGGLEWSSN